MSIYYKSLYNLNSLSSTAIPIDNVTIIEEDGIIKVGEVDFTTHITGTTSASPQFERVYVGQTGTLDNNELTSKAYVDGEISGLTGFLKTDGTNQMIGDLNAGLFQIINVANPSSNLHAVNLNYLETQLNDYLPLSGGTMTGNINMANNRVTSLGGPTGAHDATNKQYVDGLIDGLTGEYLQLSGGTMSGVIDMGNNYIQNLRSPLVNSDAATKLYVDTAVATGGSFLPLAGGTMSGAINMSNNKINLSTDTTVFISNSQLETQGDYYFDGRNISASFIFRIGIPELEIMRINGLGLDMSYPVDMSNNLINNLADCIAPQDAANKKYVDDEIAGLTGSYLQLSGGTMTGAVNMGSNLINSLANPSVGTDAANKNYVDGEISGLTGAYLQLSGGTMSGNILYSTNGLVSAPLLNLNTVGGFYTNGSAIKTAISGNDVLEVAPSYVLSKQPLRLPDGTASIPSLTFENDTNTGIYRHGSEVLGMTTNGTARCTISQTYFNVLNTLTFTSATNQGIGNASLAFNSSGTCLIGTTTNTDTLAVDSNKIAIDGDIEQVGDLSGDNYILQRGQFCGNSRIVSVNTCKTSINMSKSFNIGEFIIEVKYTSCRTIGSTPSESQFCFRWASTGYAGLIHGINIDSQPVNVYGSNPTSTTTLFEIYFQPEGATATVYNGLDIKIYSMGNMISSVNSYSTSDLGSRGLVPSISHTYTEPFRINNVQPPINQGTVGLSYGNTSSLTITAPALSGFTPSNIGCNWLKVGNNVHCSLFFSWTASAAVGSRYTIYSTLPVSASFSSFLDLMGSGVDLKSSGSNSALVSCTADTVLERCEMLNTNPHSSTETAGTVNITFQYKTS